MDVAAFWMCSYGDYCLPLLHEELLRALAYTVTSCLQLKSTGYNVIHSQLEITIFKRGYFSFPGQDISCSHMQIYTWFQVTIKHWNQPLFQCNKFSDVHFYHVCKLQFITSFSDNKAVSFLKL